MKSLLSLVLLFILGGPLLPSSLDGFYHSEDGLTIHISNGQAVFSYSEGHSIERTVAVCTITEEDEHFIRIDSPTPYDRVMDCIHFEESYSADFHPDSVYVTFDFPVRNEEYWIEICDDKNNTLIPCKEFKYPEQKQIVIPRAIPSLNSYSWGIKSKGFSLTSELFKLYVALDLWCVFPISYRNYRTNILRISVPCIDDDFFEQAWIKGEYIKVCDEGLIWRGSLFRREKDKKEGIPLMVTGPETGLHYDNVQIKPSFQKDPTLQSFHNWVDANLYYPKEQPDAQGRVIVDFDIMPDGTVSNVVITKGVCDTIDRVTQEVLLKSPKWEPGKVHDIPVKTRITGFEIIWKLQ